MVVGGHLPDVAGHAVEPVTVLHAPARRPEVILPPVEPPAVLGVIIGLARGVVVTPGIRLAREPAACGVLEFQRGRQPVNPPFFVAPPAQISGHVAAVHKDDRVVLLTGRDSPPFPMERSRMPGRVHKRFVLGIRDGMIEDLEILHAHRGPALPRPRPMTERAALDEDETAARGLSRARDTMHENRRRQKNKAISHGSTSSSQGLRIIQQQVIPARRRLIKKQELHDRLAGAEALHWNHSWARHGTAEGRKIRCPLLGD